VTAQFVLVVMNRHYQIYYYALLRLDTSIVIELPFVYSRLRGRFHMCC